jgi:hypothetical protein
LSVAIPVTIWLSLVSRSNLSSPDLCQSSQDFIPLYYSHPSLGPRSSSLQPSGSTIQALSSHPTFWPSASILWSPTFQPPAFVPHAIPSCGHANRVVVLRTLLPHLPCCVHQKITAFLHINSSALIRSGSFSIPSLDYVL